MAKMSVVYVSADDTEEFKSSHIGDTITSDDSQYYKVAFLEVSNEIATHGSLYGGTKDGTDIVLGDVTPYDSDYTVLNSSYSITQTFTNIEKEIIDNEQTIAKAITYVNTLVDTANTDISNINAVIPTAASSTNQLADKTYVTTQLQSYESEHQIRVENMTETSAVLDPNIFYVWEEVEALDIAFNAPSDESIYNEYMFQFTSGSTPTTLSMPDDITWFQDNNVISANKTYQISIVNNLAVLGEF